METTIITQEEIKRILTPSEAIKAVRKAFKAYSSGKAEMPPKSYLNFPHGDLRAMPAYLHGQGFHMAGVKSVNVHPRNGKYNLPTVMAVIVLTDPDTGKKKGRTGTEEITLFDSTGLAIQDIACASVVYKAQQGKRRTKTIRLFSSP